jgi:hypothetical protein
VATFFEIVESEPERVVLVRANLPIRLGSPSFFGRFRDQVVDLYVKTLEGLRAIAVEVRAKPALAPLFLFLGALLLLAGALIAMAIVLLAVAALLILPIFGWALVFSASPSFRRRPPPSNASPRKGLPHRIGCADGILTIDSQHVELRPEALAIQVARDELGLASLSVHAAGAMPFSLVVDGVRGMEAGIELALRMARALGFSKYTGADEDDAYRLCFARAAPDEDARPYREGGVQEAGVVPRFDRPLEHEAEAPRPDPRATFAAAQSLADDPRISKVGDELRFEYARTENAGRGPAMLRALGAAVGLAVLVRAGWLFAEVQSGDFGSTSWIMAAATLVLVGTKWLVHAHRETSSDPTKAIVDAKKRSVDVPDVGRLDDVRAVLARETAAPRRVAVWIISGRGDSKLWEADASGREAAAWQAACELASSVATMLGVDSARLHEARATADVKAN